MSAVSRQDVRREILSTKIEIARNKLQRPGLSEERRDKIEKRLTMMERRLDRLEHQVDDKCEEHFKKNSAAAATGLPDDLLLQMKQSHCEEPHPDPTILDAAKNADLSPSDRLELLQKIRARIRDQPDD